MSRLARLRRRVKVRRLQLKKARRDYKKAKKLSKKSLGSRALAEAQELIGVMESGGNNKGKMVTHIIKANGGIGPEPWCGDFVAYCYKKAGSKRVSRSWAKVSFLANLYGIVKVDKPKAGDLVVYTFDHVGIYEKAVNGKTIQAIEGNTGKSGAVSDSKTGGDGVYRKHRPKLQVKYYLRVTA